jgi:hypothetical protein
MVARTRFPPPGTRRHVWDPPPSVAQPAPFGAPAFILTFGRSVAGRVTPRSVASGLAPDQLLEAALTHLQRPLDLEEVGGRGVVADLEVALGQVGQA